MARCRLGGGTRNRRSAAVSFQAYLDNIKAKTGKGPDELRQWGTDRGFATGSGLADGVKVGTIVAALKAELGLGHGHAMAVVALLKCARREGREA
jgi:hypothetical protein